MNIIFLNGVPESSFQKVESGIYVAIVDGPGGLTLVRKKYGTRSAIEMTIVLDLVEDFAGRMAPPPVTKH